MAGIDKIIINLSSGETPEYELRVMRGEDPVESYISPNFQGLLSSLLTYQNSCLLELRSRNHPPMDGDPYARGNQEKPKFVPYDLSINCTLPGQERKILETIVETHNSWVDAEQRAEEEKTEH